MNDDLSPAHGPAYERGSRDLFLLATENTSSLVHVFVAFAVIKIQAGLLQKTIRGQAILSLLTMSIEVIEPGVIVRNCVKKCYGQSE